METKFEIGDIIRSIKLNDPSWDWKVTKIVFEKQTVYEVGIGYFENCYVLYNHTYGYYSFLNFIDECRYSFVSSSKDKFIIISSCPSCGGELKEKYSEWSGGNIKKCSNCGWC